MKTQNPDAWQKTLFLVTFDEHGGCYDHVPPPAVPAPPGEAVADAPVDRYGVRVPTVVISPNVHPDSLFRAQSCNGQALDHSSILRAVFDCYIGSDIAINGRDLNAPSFSGAMTPNEVNPGLTTKPTFPDVPALSDEVRKRLASESNHLSQMWERTQKPPS